MPETGLEIYNSLKNLKNTYIADTLEDAVKIAKKVTQKNKICLLSPSASSYNDFKNFEEKGRLYKEYIKSNIM